MAFSTVTEQPTHSAEQYFTSSMAQPFQTTTAPQHVFPVTSLKKDIRRFFFKALLKSRAKRLSPIILKALGNSTSLLDLGCGDMILTEHLNHHSKIAITALDTIDTNLSQLPLMLYTGTTIPYANGSFDATMVAFVLHHCTDIESILLEIKRVSSQRILILEEIYSGFYTKKLLQMHDFGNRFLSSKMHIPLNFLKIEEWHAIFERIGLKLVNSTRIYQYRMLNCTHQILFELVPV